MCFGYNSRSNLLGSDKQTMARATSPPLGEKEATSAAYHGDNDKSKEGATTDYMDFSRPYPFPENGEFDMKKYEEWCRLRSFLRAKSKPNDIIIPDPTPKRVRDLFLDIVPRLSLILRKDSVRCYLRLLRSEMGMRWDLNITAETLTFIVSHNALRCARVVLEGKAPQLNGMHANPNCMNQYGYFVLHEAADRFSVDMIKLLFRHGASANVRTIGNKVIEDLLSLHVAVENACKHKYLEDNLSPRQDYQDYTYNLIHLLCLPEMKIFLDTIRLLAGKTDNLVDELWKYIKEKRVVETAVLLLAAQGHIRVNRSSKRNVNGNRNGFEVIMDRILEHYDNSQRQLEEMTSSKCTYLLVRIISRAGEALDTYIKHHSEVPHVEVLEQVSSILKDFGFCPTGEGIDARNLRPYDCKTSHRELHDKGATNRITESAHAAGKKIVRKQIPRGWDPEYRIRMFFPYWRSVLGARCEIKVNPIYAPEPASKMYLIDMLAKKRQAASNCQPTRPFGTAAFMGNGSSRNPNHNLLLERVWKPTSNHRSSRLFGTAAFTLLKLLKNA